MFFLSQLYCVAVKAADRGRLTEQELADQLLAVLSEAPGLRPPPLLALLTASDRDTWAKARDILLNQGNNICHRPIVFQRQYISMDYKSHAIYEAYSIGFLKGLKGREIKALPLCIACLVVTSHPI